MSTESAGCTMRFFFRPSLAGLACAEKWDECHAMLDRGGGDVRGRKYGWTALHVAAGDGQLGLIDKLLARGADIDAKNQNGVTPLHLAARLYEPAAVERLMEKGANVKVKDNDGRTALHIAASKGQLDLIDKLLAMGADIDAKDKHGYTPLHSAALKNQPAALERLMDEGADTEFRNENGLTAMHWAAKHGHLALIDKLLAKGADIEAKGNMPGFLGGTEVQGCTPLYFAAWENQSVAAERLVENGADVNAKDGDGKTPANRARHEGHTDLAAWFDRASSTIFAEKVHQASSLNSQLSDLFTTLHISDKLPAAVAWCLEQGADDINDLQTQEHVTALASHLRLSPIKHEKLVDALLAAGSTSPPSAPAAVHAKLTSQLADMFSALSLSNKLSTAVAWCEEQGADDINDLQSQKHAAALASYLRLPPIKHDKFVNALLTAGSP